MIYDSIFKKVNPKVFLAIGILLAVIVSGLIINAKIKSFGETRYDAGVSDTRAAVTAKVKEAKKKVQDIIEAGEIDAAETQTVYVEVTKEIAVVDAVVLAENSSLKMQLKTLNQRIQNETIDNSYCAVQPIPDDSLSIHQDIDRLLSGG